MKKKLCILLLISITGSLWGQTDSLNQFKYWHLRQRFLDHFILLGSGHGHSVPANVCIINAENTEDPASRIYKKLDWGADATANLGWYIGVLATEIHLLQKEGQNTEATARELYYALAAFDRLDLYAELAWGYSNDNDCRVDFATGEPVTWDETRETWLPKPGSKWDTLRNGFFLRMDGPPGFIKHFPGIDIINVVLTRPWNLAQNTLADYQRTPKDLGYRTIGYWRSNESSQDQVFNLLMGMMLTIEFAGDAMYREESLSGKAREIALRMLDFYNRSWTFKNPVTRNLCNGGGNSGWFAGSLRPLKKYFESGIKNNRNSQLLFWGWVGDPCSRPDKQYQINRHLYAIITALSNATSHVDMCRYVTEKDGFDWGFYYLLRKALYPHEPRKGCDYTIEALREDLDLCPLRGPFWDEYLYTEDGTYKTKGKFLRNNGNPDDTLYKPRKWFFPNRYMKTCFNNEERGEFTGLDYMLLLNLARIVHGSDAVNAIYTPLYPLEYGKHNEFMD